MFLYIFRTLTLAQGVIHKLCHPFFEIFDPSLLLVTHFTKQAYRAMSPFGSPPSSLAKWVTSFMDAPCPSGIIFEKNRTHILLLQGPGGFDKFCECDLNLWDCDKEGNKSRPEKWKSYSGDVFFNLPQNWDVNDWILQTHNDFLSARFGGFSIGSGKKNRIFSLTKLFFSFK